MVVEVDEVEVRRVDERVAVVTEDAARSTGSGR